MCIAIRLRRVVPLDRTTQLIAHVGNIALDRSLGDAEFARQPSRAARALLDKRGVEPKHTRERRRTGRGTLRLPAAAGGGRRSHEVKLGDDSTRLRLPLKRRCSKAAVLL